MNLVTIKNYLDYINLFHMIIIGPMFVYFGKNKENTTKWISELIVLLVLGIFYSVHFPQNTKNIRFTDNYWNIISYLHYIIIVPFLLYLAYYHKQNIKFSKNTYESLLIFGLTVILYHTYKLVNRNIINKNN